MKIFLAGGTGLVGSALTAHLLQRGHQVSALVRSAGRAAALPAGVETVNGDPTRPGPWQQSATAAEVVINLTGATIFTRWNPAAKRRILESRVLSTRHLAAALAAAADDGHRRTLINASAAGYYGFDGDEPKTEQSPPGHDFLAQVCREWEQAALAAGRPGLRVVTARLGVVLDRNGGALARMLPFFRLGLGGRLGDGRQWFPWIHLDDLVEIFSFIIEQPEISGPVNCAAPQTISNAEFTRALGRALHRPALLPLPGFLLRLALGEMSSLLLQGSRMVPAVLQEKGFDFRFPRLDQALADLVKRRQTAAPALLLGLLLSAPPLWSAAPAWSAPDYGPAAAPAMQPARPVQPSRAATQSYDWESWNVIGSTREHPVRGRESLLEIARSYGLGYQEIVRANPGLDLLLPGEGVTVLVPGARVLPEAPFRQGLLVNLAEKRAYYFYQANDENLVTSFPVGIGDQNYQTPLGDFTITAKLINPSWTVPSSIRERKPYLPPVVPPGPDNPMGSHALQLSRGSYFIHGTNRPWSIGRRATNGCIRLYPEDIPVLFSLISRGTPVRIVQQPVKIGQRQGTIYIEVHHDGKEEPAYRQMAEELLVRLGVAEKVDREKMAEALRLGQGFAMPIGHQ